MNKSASIISVILFLVIIRAAFLPYFPLTDNTESRYAVIAADMESSGDWITPRVWMSGKQVPYLGKPPLHFWAAALSVHLFGRNEFAVRLPAFVFSLLLIALLHFVVRRYWDGEIADSAALILFSSAMFFAFSGTVILDMTLTFFIAAAVLCHYALTKESSRNLKRIYSILVFVFLGLGFLTKGPVCLVLFGMPVFLWLVLYKKWAVLRDYDWLTGIAAFALITVPWFALAEARSPGFLEYFFVNENLLRFISSDYGDRYGWGHVLPYGTAALFFLAAALPWSIWCIVLASRKCGREKIKSMARNQDSGLFLLAAAGIILFLCFARQLVAAYVLPALPFFAVCAAALFRESGIPGKQIAVVCCVSVIIYSAFVLAILPRAEERYSSKQVLSVARAIHKSPLGGKVIFLSDMPYSAYFYGRELIAPWDKDLLKNLDLQYRPAQGSFYILKQNDSGAIPGPVQDKLTVVYSSNTWRIYR